MAFSGKPFFQIPRPIRRKGFLNVETIIADKTLVAKDSAIQVLNGGGSDFNVNLPLELDGISYQILNSGGTNSLSVKNAAGTEQVSLASGESSLLVCNGTVWVAI